VVLLPQAIGHQLNLVQTSVITKPLALTGLQARLALALYDRRDPFRYSLLFCQRRKPK
jgi:hypothetical protein